MVGGGVVVGGGGVVLGGAVVAGGGVVVVGGGTVDVVGGPVVGVVLVALVLVVLVVAVVLVLVVAVVLVVAAVLVVLPAPRGPVAVTGLVSFVTGAPPCSWLASPLRQPAVTSRAPAITDAATRRRIRAPAGDRPRRGASNPLLEREVRLRSNPFAAVPIDPSSS